MSTPTQENQDGQEDDALLKRFLNASDRQALDRLLRAHADAAFRVAKRIMGNGADAEDVVQVAFMQVIDKARSYRRESGFRAWLLAIVANAARQRLRADRSRRHHELASSQPNQGLVAASSEAHDALHRALNELPEHERLPVWLRYLDGLPFKEVAAVLNIPEGTARMQVQRGLERVRLSLGRLGYGLGTVAIAGMISGAAEAAEVASPTLTAGVAKIAAGATAPSVGVFAASGLLGWSVAAVLTATCAGAGWWITTLGNASPVPAPVSVTPTPAAQPVPDVRVAPVAIVGIHVSPDGTAAGDGTQAHPLDLATALSSASPARPGDTIWLHAGTYHGSYISNVAGTEQARVVVRQVPGERAVIDAGATDALAVYGPWVDFRDFEITDSRLATRTSERPYAMNLRGKHVRCINLVIHDCSYGIGCWSNAVDAEVYGCLIWNCTSTQGYALSLQNASGTKHIEECLIFDNSRHGLHAYGSAQAKLEHMRLIGNAFFGSENLLGGQCPVDDVLLQDNFFIATPGRPALQLGYGGVMNGSVALENNLTVADGVGWDVRNWRQITVSGNTVVAPQVATLASLPATQKWNGNTYAGSVNPFMVSGKTMDAQQWIAIAGESITRFASADPIPDRVILRPNRHEPGRAHVLAYVPSGAAQITVDIATVVARGARYEIRDARAWLGKPMVSGVADGSPVRISVKAADVFSAFVLTSVPPQP